MKKNLVIEITLLVAIAGLLFSGYLSYVEMSGQGSSCTLTKSILGLPTCVFGFIMYAVIFVLLILAIKSAS